MTSNKKAMDYRPTKAINKDVSTCENKTLTESSKYEQMWNQIAGAVVAKVPRGIIKREGSKSAKTVAKEWVSTNIIAPIKTSIGEVVFDQNTIDNSLGHGYGAEKLDAIPAIKDVLERGVYIGNAPDFNGATIINHYFAGKATIGKDDRIIFCRVREADGDNGRKRFYIHEIFSEEEIKKSSTLQTGSASNGQMLGGRTLYKQILQELYGVKSGIFKVWLLGNLFLPGYWVNCFYLIEENSFMRDKHERFFKSIC